MPVTLELADDVVARLRREADRRGMSLEALVTELASLLPHPPAQYRGRRLSFIGIGTSSSGHHAADAEEMLADGFGRD